MLAIRGELSDVLSAATLDRMAAEHEFVGEVRGLGAMLALELDTRERAFATVSLRDLLDLDAIEPGSHRLGRFVAP